jgi:hypothetical protein
MNLFTACVGESCVIKVTHARRHIFNPHHQDKKSKRRTCTMSLDPAGSTFLIVDDCLLLSLSRECLSTFFRGSKALECTPIVPIRLFSDSAEEDPRLQYISQ